MTVGIVERIHRLSTILRPRVHDVGEAVSTSVVGAYQSHEFHISNIELLKGMQVEIGISSHVMETRDNTDFMRELKVALAYPDQLDFEKDI